MPFFDAPFFQYPIQRKGAESWLRSSHRRNSAAERKNFGAGSSRALSLAVFLELVAQVYDERATRGPGRLVPGNRPAHAGRAPVGVPDLPRGTEGRRVVAQALDAEAVERPGRHGQLLACGDAEVQIHRALPHGRPADDVEAGVPPLADVHLQRIVLARAEARAVGMHAE